jgi:hypothetical protein
MPHLFRVTGTKQVDLIENLSSDKQALSGSLALILHHSI